MKQNTACSNLVQLATLINQFLKRCGKAIDAWYQSIHVFYVLVTFHHIILCHIIGPDYAMGCVVFLYSYMVQVSYSGFGCEPKNIII